MIFSWQPQKSLRWLTPVICGEIEDPDTNASMPALANFLVRDQAAEDGGQKAVLSLKTA
jgi:hypothetical protein